MTPPKKKETPGDAEVGTTPPDTRAPVTDPKDATRDEPATPAPAGEKADAADAVKPGEATTPAAATYAIAGRGGSCACTAAGRVPAPRRVVCLHRG